MHKELLISVHIEKCGGTSIREEYHKSFGKDRTIIYKPSRTVDRRYHKSSDYPFDAELVSIIRTRLRQHPSLLSFFNFLHGNMANQAIKPMSLDDTLNLKPRPAVVHGHLIPNEYVVNQSFSPIFTTVLRNPYARAKSHYRYWQDKRGNTDFNQQIPYDPQLSFRDFINLEEMRNFQTRRIESIPISSFAVIGILEKLDLFITNITKILRQYEFEICDDTQHSCKHINEAPRSTRFTNIQDPDLLREFEKINQEDYRLYKYAESMQT